MNKLLLIIVVLLLIIGAGAGGYIYGMSQRSPAENTNAAKTEPKEEKAEEDSVDVAAIMDAVEARFSTVTETKVFNESNDPNGSLGKPKSYVSGGAFWDTRTNFADDEADPGKWGTDAGGAVEVFANADDAKARTDLLKEAQGTILDAGAVEQVDKVVLRASSKLTKTQQDEILAFLKAQL